MIFYIATDQDGRRHLVGTQADAKAIDRNYVQEDIPTDKGGLMAYVQGLLDRIEEAHGAYEAKIGAIETQAGVAPEMETSDLEATHSDPPAPSEPVRNTQPISDSYSQRSVEIDEIFENLPLPHQLHLAALALENARSRVK